MIDFAYGNRRLDLAGVAALVLLAAVMLSGPARAQSGEPIKIGYSMSLTGRSRAEWQGGAPGASYLGRAHKRKRRNARPAREAHLL